MTWIQAVVSIVCAVVGGFTGGWVVAFRMGSWRQRVEDHLRSIEERLIRGDETLDRVPIVDTRMDVVLEEIRALKKEMREERRRFVSHEECNRRHDGT